MFKGVKNFIGGMDPGARSSMLWGAGIGGAYGLWSEDTSVLGGAVMGAGVGLGVGVYRIGKASGGWTKSSGHQPVIPVMSSFSWRTAGEKI